MSKKSIPEAKAAAEAVRPTDAPVSPDAPVTPSDRKAEGDQSTDTSRAKAQSGAGNPAGPASARAEDRDRYPLLAAAMDKLVEALPSTFQGRIMVRVSAKVEGFRRAGVAHTGTREYEADHFAPEQIEQLMAEPMLVTELVAVPAQ